MPTTALARQATTPNRRRLTPLLLFLILVMLQQLLLVRSSTTTSTSSSARASTKRASAFLFSTIRDTRRQWWSQSLASSPPCRRAFATASSWNADSSHPNSHHHNNKHDHDQQRLLDEVELSLKGPCGLPNTQNKTPPHSLVIAVSGGVDSMALLHLLAAVRPRWQPPLKLTVAHFNHGLRPEAEEEEKFVREAAAQLQVPIYVAKWSEEESGKKTGIQERARHWRRAECEALLDQEKEKEKQASLNTHNSNIAQNQHVIATAHHADDSMETFVLKLLRGAHLSHLKGMEPRAGPFIKPLLHCSKETLIDYLTQKQLDWKEDASNQQDKYKRNKVRLQLLPLMSEIAGGEAALKVRMEELSIQSRGLEGWLEKEAESWERRYDQSSKVVKEVTKENELWIGVGMVGNGQATTRSDDGDDDISLWAPLPRLLKEELIHRFVRRVTGDKVSLPYGQVRRVMEQLQRDEDAAAGGQRKKLQWRLEVGEKWVLERQGEVLRVIQTEEGEESGRKPSSVVMADKAAGVSLDVVPPGWHVEAARLSPAAVAAAAAAAAAAAKGKKEQEWDLILHNVPLGAQLQLRHRHDGDRFQPPWRAGPIKLKDFLRGQNIPLHRRDEVLLICQVEGGGGKEKENESEKVLAIFPPTHVAKEAAAAEAGGNEPVVVPPPLALRLRQLVECKG